MESHFMPAKEFISMNSNYKSPAKSALALKRYTRYRDKPAREKQPFLLKTPLALHHISTEGQKSLRFHAVRILDFRFRGSNKASSRT